MTDDARRKILEAVAAGRLDPSEAADRLADIDAGFAVDDEPAESLQVPIERRAVDRESGDPPITCIKVDGSFRSIEIIGDETVREAVAEGPHRVRWEGDTLVIDGASGSAYSDDSDDGDDDRPDFGEWFRTSTRGGPHRVGMAFRDASNEYRPRPLRVRVNPRVPLEARVEAGPLTIRRVKGPVKARVAAGPLVIEGFESPIDVRVSAGKVDARGRVDHGVSTIDCDAGKVRLHLEHGTDARVNASATLGKVGFGGRTHRRERFDWRGGGDLSDLGERLAGMLNNAFSDDHEVVVGRGTGVIDIRVSMGSADITFDDEPNE